MFTNLKCNNIQCRTEIKRFIAFTTCGHAFCFDCANRVKKVMICLACSTRLLEHDITPNEIDKMPSLIGFPIENLFEALRKSTNFWIFQLQDELNFITSMSKQKIESLTSDHLEQKNAVSRYMIAIDKLQNRVNAMEMDLNREKEMSYDLDRKLSDKSKEVNRLTALNEKLKFNYRHIEDNK